MNERGSITRRSLLLCWLSFCLALVLSGCKPEAKAPADLQAAGSYALVSVDGQPVPCSVAHEGRTMTVKSGAFTIHADGTCGSKVTLTKPAGGDVTVETKASYTRQGGTLTMKWEGAGVTTGTVAGDTFTMNNEGMVFAYRK